MTITYLDQGMAKLQIIRTIAEWSCFSATSALLRGKMMAVLKVPLKHKDYGNNVFYLIYEINVELCIKGMIDEAKLWRGT